MGGGPPPLPHLLCPSQSMAHRLNTKAFPQRGDVQQLRGREDHGGLNRDGGAAGSLDAKTALLCNLYITTPARYSVCAFTNRRMGGGWPRWSEASRGQQTRKLVSKAQPIPAWYTEFSFRFTLSHLCTGHSTSKDGDIG